MAILQHKKELSILILIFALLVFTLVSVGSIPAKEFGLGIPAGMSEVVR